MSSKYRSFHRVLIPAMLAFCVANGRAEGAETQVGVAPSLTDEQKRTLDDTLERIRTDARVPGLAVGIIDDGVLVYARGFGVRDLATGKPVDAETLFHLASISKTFTTTAIMQLVERGQIALDDPVERLLPEFAGSGVLIRHLLTHSAGLKDWSRPTGTAEPAAVGRYVSRIARHRLAYAPGTGWAYSDADFNILGAAIEKASGRSFCEYLEEQIFPPAGMTRANCRQPGGIDNTAWPHRGESKPRRAGRHPWDLVFLPSSGIEASISDLMRWAALQLQRDPRLLQAASYDAMFEPRVATSWEGVSMGLGWQLEKRGEAWLPRHPGGDPGFRSLLTLYPAQYRAIGILSNGESTPRWEMREAIEKILDR
jgi:CubicO group peptidase (beta-lactamase class C family)